MTNMFDNWYAAHTEALLKARRANLDVAIRKARQGGKDYYLIRFADHVDYVHSEIVKPIDPR